MLLKSSDHGPLFKVLEANRADLVAACYEKGPTSYTTRKAVSSAFEVLDVKAQISSKMKKISCSKNFDQDEA